MRSNKKAIMFGLLIVAVALGLGTGLYWFFTQKKPTAPKATATKTVAVDSNADFKVDLDKLDMSRFEHISDLFLDSSMPSQAKARTKKSGFSDAVSFPFKDYKKSKKGYSKEELESMFTELEEEIFRNPVVGDMIIQGLIDRKIAKDKTVGDDNPWMAEFLAKLNEARKKASGEHPRGLEIWLETRDASGTIYVTKEYRRYAAGVCTLLERMIPDGVKTKKSSENYRLNSSSEGSLVRAEKADYEEKEPSLILLYRDKNGKVRLRIGFNLLDKRLELFKEEPPSKKGPKKDPKTKKESKSDPKKDETWTDPGEDPKRKKKRHKKKVEEDPGSGQNQKGDGAGESRQDDKRKKNFTGTENDNNHGHSDPKTVVPSTSEPGQTDPSRANVKVDKTDENKMDYQPDTGVSSTWTNTSNGQTETLSKAQGSGVEAGVGTDTNISSDAQGTLLEPSVSD